VTKRLKAKIERIAFSPIELLCPFM